MDLWKMKHLKKWCFYVLQHQRVQEPKEVPVFLGQHLLQKTHFAERIGPHLIYKYGWLCPTKKYLHDCLFTLSKTWVFESNEKTGVYLVRSR